MKHFRRLLTLVVALVMTLGLVAPVFAEKNTQHTITIDNTDQNVAHTYEAYQVFLGKLDATESKLSDIEWGSGVNAANLVKALQETTDTKLAALKAAVADVDTTVPAEVAAIAGKVAEVVGTFNGTSGADQSAGAIDAFAAIVANNLGTKTADFTPGTGENAGKYTAAVTGDGYYFVKDTTGAAALKDDDTGKADTNSKYLLSVIKDTTIVAKDTGLNPDKKINDGTNKVAADSAAIGDEVKFEVKVAVPNTKKYEDHFVFNMTDTLQNGLTYFGKLSIKIDGTDLPAANYEATVKTGDAAFTVPSDAATAVTTTGGQTLKVVFKDFKNYVETNNLIGKEIVITYSAILNEKATYGATANENEVKFIYSNDPNHDYDGDEPKQNDPTGETPFDKTRTYSTKIKLTKVDEDGNVLAGATFELSGNELNTVLITGEKYVASDYTLEDGEAFVDGTYYALTNGSYTTTSPKTPNMNTSQYVDPTGETTFKLVKFSKAVTQQSSKKVTATSGPDGVIVFEGLNAGSYTLKETQAPDGFNLLTDEIGLTISWTDPEADGVAQTVKDAGGFTVSDTDKTTGWTLSADGSEYSIQIENKSGTELPSTGGMGTTLFYVVGTLLVLGAGVVLVSKRKVSE